MRADPSWWCKLVLLFAFALPTPAFAEPASAVSVEWRGPGTASGCLGATGLIAGVEDALGHAIFSRTPSDLVLSVSISRLEGFGWRAFVEVLNARGSVLGERELVSETDSCASLNEPLVFTVMLMVDSQLAERAQSAEPRPPIPGTRRDSASHARSAPEPPPALEAGVFGAFGPLPHPTLGAELSAELFPWRWLGVRAHLAALLPSSRSVEGSAEARFGLYEGGVLACPGLELGQLRLAGCGGVEGGLLSAHSSGFAGDGVRARPFFGVSAGLRARLRILEHLSVTMNARALFPQTRERFVYRVESEPRPLFEMSRVCAWVGMGVAFDL